MKPLPDTQLNDFIVQSSNDPRNKQATYAHALDYLRILNKWKIIIAILTITSAFKTGISDLSSERVYTSEVSFLFPSDQLSNSRSDLIEKTLGPVSTRTPSSIIIVIGKSRRMAEDVAEKFFPDDFKAGGGRREQIVRRVRNMIDIYEAGEVVKGIIKVKSNAPQLSADIANFCVAHLDVLNEKVKISLDRPLVRIIDPAIPPIYPDVRNIKQRVVRSMLLAILGGSFLAVCIEYLKNFAYKKA